MEGFLKRYLGLYRPLISQLNDLLSEDQLSYAMWQVIFYLNKHGSSTLVEIANHYNVEKPTITRRVHRLEEMDLLQTIPSKDRREKVIQLTKTGAKLYTAYRKKITELENHLMQGVTKEEQQAMDALFTKAKNNLLLRKGLSNE